jgi:cytidylate kinase
VRSAKETTDVAPGAPRLASEDDVLAAVGGLRDGPVLIGVDGPFGAGKTTIALRIRDRLRAKGSVGVVHLDTYHTTRMVRRRPFVRPRPVVDLDVDRLRTDVLEPLDAGGAPRVQVGREQWETVEHPYAIIIEGMFAFDERLRDRYDLRVWVTASDDERRRRFERRSGGEVGGIELLEDAVGANSRDVNHETIADFIISTDS